jgi:alpha-tubulin suppressor-like RCC1 family protein
LTSYSSPVQTVAAGTNWKQVVCGVYHTAAIKTDGTLWLWGYNIIGQLGTNDRVTYSSPVQTVAGGTNWKQVAAGSGSNFTVALYNYDANNLYPSR